MRRAQPGQVANGGDVERWLYALNPFQEPSGPPPGFGVRQSSGALDGLRGCESGRGLPHSKTLTRLRAPSPPEEGNLQTKPLVQNSSRAGVGLRAAKTVRKAWRGAVATPA